MKSNFISLDVDYTFSRSKLLQWGRELCNIQKCVRTRGQQTFHSSYLGTDLNICAQNTIPHHEEKRNQNSWPGFSTQHISKANKNHHKTCMSQKNYAIYKPRFFSPCDCEYHPIEVDSRPTMKWPEPEQTVDLSMDLLDIQQDRTRRNIHKNFKLWHISKNGSNQFLACLIWKLMSSNTFKQDYGDHES